MKAVQLHPYARLELLEAADYYEERRPGLAAEFTAEVDRAVELIRPFPEAGSPRKRTGFRAVKVGRFPYLLHYLNLPDCIWIAAVAHAKRRPGYWRGRKLEPDE